MQLQLIKCSECHIGNFIEEKRTRRRVIYKCNHCGKEFAIKKYSKEFRHDQGRDDKIPADRD